MAPSTALRPPTAEMLLSEHLGELRARLIRCVLYLALGLVAGWVLYPQVYELLWNPMHRVLSAHPGWKPQLLDVMEGFSLRLQISFVTGLLLALPLVTLEGWGFLAPGLTA